MSRKSPPIIRFDPSIYYDYGISARRRRRKVMLGFMLGALLLAGAFVLVQALWPGEARSPATAQREETVDSLTTYNLAQETREMGNLKNRGVMVAPASVAVRRVSAPSSVVAPETVPLAETPSGAVAETGPVLPAAAENNAETSLSGASPE